MNMNEENDQKFCDDCGFKYQENDMMERRDGR